jgi:hypothetical protein
LKLDLDNLPVVMILSGLVGLAGLSVGSALVDNPEPLLVGMGIWGSVITAGVSLAAIRGGRRNGDAG